MTELTNPIIEHTAMSRSIALRCREQLTHYRGPLADSSVAEKALNVLHCSQNRILTLFDSAHQSAGDQNWAIAALAARALMTCVGYNALMYFRLKDDPDRARQIVESFYTSNDVKRKLYKNVALASKLHVAEHAKSRFGSNRTARISSGEAIKNGLGRLIREQNEPKFEMVMEHYDRLSEACHDSQVSIVYMFSSLGDGTESSAGPVDFQQVIELDVWQALALIAAFQHVSALGEELYPNLI